MSNSSIRYVLLLLAQTLCAGVVLFHIQAVFRALLVNIGVRQSFPGGYFVLMLAAAVIGQACYWYRLRTTPIPPGYRNLAIGHVFSFLGRISFIFGGSLFSLYFLRHLPAMDLNLLGFGLLWRGVFLIAVLFGLYCYTLELERLGTAMQTPRSQHMRDVDPDGL